MFSQWIDARSLQILHQTNIFHSIAIFIIFITFMFSFCSRNAPESSREPKKVKSQRIPVDTSVTAPDTSTTKQFGGAGAPKEKSSKGKNEMLDSIKIIRGKKNIRKARQMTTKKEDTDSQHTEIINVPLGKASESATGVSKLTAPTEQKHVEKPNGKKIQFAEKIVKSTISPDANAGTKTLKSPNTK